MRHFLMVPVLLAALVASFAFAPFAAAADSPVGSTYVKKAQAKDGEPEMTLSVEAWGPGKIKLTWHIHMKGTDMVLSLVSAVDGKDAPLLMGGKPSGETMAIKLIDKLHSSTIVKMNGQPFGTSKATFSPDYKTMTVENDFSGPVGNNPAGKTTEVWVRK